MFLLKVATINQELLYANIKFLVQAYELKVKGYKDDKIGEVQCPSDTVYQLNEVDKILLNFSCEGDIYQIAFSKNIAVQICQDYVVYIVAPKISHDYVNETIKRGLKMEILGTEEFHSAAKDVISDLIKFSRQN